MVLGHGYHTAQHRDRGALLAGRRFARTTRDTGGIKVRVRWVAPRRDGRPLEARASVIVP